MSVKRQHKISSKIGLPPGSLVHVGKKHDDDVSIYWTNYSEDQVQERSVPEISDIEALDLGSGCHWVNVNGLHDVKRISAIGRKFSLHDLLLEDVLNTLQRPKSEAFDQHLFITFKMLGMGTKDNELVSEQVSLVLGDNYVISFQEHEGDIFDTIRERLRTNGSNLRKNGADFLMYRLLDTVVDHYFLVTERLSELSEELEEQVLDDPNQDQLEVIRSIRRKLRAIKRAVVPLREAVLALHREDPKFIQKKTIPYLRDVYEHIVQAIDHVETQREVLAGIMDLYHTGVSNNMNQVMKVLTIIATLFIPTTFIAGLYGMNFDNMPELHWNYGYQLALGVMAAVFIGMLIFFRKKNWL